MARNAAEARRAIKLTGYTTGQLVDFLRSTDSMTDYAMVGGLLCAREEQLKATLADALKKVQAHEELRRASLGAEEEAGAVVMAAVSQMHEAGTKKQAEVSAKLDAALAEIHAVLHTQREELSASMAMIVQETEAKLKASFAKIRAPLKEPNQETRGLRALLTLWGRGTPSIPVAQQSKQPVVEKVKVNKGKRGRASADGSAGKSLKRKANAVENRGVSLSPSPVQISSEQQEMMEDIDAPPGFSPTPRFLGELQESMEDIEVPPGFSPSSWINEEPGPSSYSTPSQAIKVSTAKVSNAVASVEESGKTVLIKEPTPLVETEESNDPSSEATQDEAAKEPAHLGGASMALITVPVQQDERLDSLTVSKRGRGRGRGRGVAKENKKNKNVSGGSGSLGSGRGLGISDTSSNLVLGARSELACRPWQAHSLNRPSPLLSAPPVQNFSANGSQSKNDDLFLQSSGHTTAGTWDLVPVMPRSSPLRINSASGSGAQNRSISGMGSKVTENLGKCVENRADSVPVINNAAEGTSYEEGDVGSNDTVGAPPRA